jgi:hypothetical protein
LTPVYKQDSIINNLVKVKVENVDGGDYAYKLRNELEYILNMEGAEVDSEYGLSVHLVKRVEPLAIQLDSYVKRYNIIISAEYTVRSLQEPFAVLAHDQVTMTSSYNALSSQFANFVAEENAVNNNVIELAKELKRRLEFLFMK